MRYKAYREQNMDEAIASVLAGSPIRAASTKFNVPSSTLSDRERQLDHAAGSFTHAFCREFGNAV